MSIRNKTVGRLRAAAFVAVVSGLFFASLHASRRAPRLVSIGAINSRMNFSTVRVQGILESDARRLQGGSVLYKVADETGSLPVFLDRTSEGMLPKAGSRVDITGRLSVDIDNRASMRVHDSRQIKVLENSMWAFVCGRVSGVWKPEPGSRAPYRIALDRPEGSLEIIHWFKPKIDVTVGDRLEAEGILGFYKGRKQIKVSNPADMRLYPER